MNLCHPIRSVGEANSQLDEIIFHVLVQSLIYSVKIFRCRPAQLIRIFCIEYEIGTETNCLQEMQWSASFHSNLILATNRDE